MLLPLQGTHIPATILHLVYQQSVKYEHIAPVDANPEWRLRSRSDPRRDVVTAVVIVDLRERTDLVAGAVGVGVDAGPVGGLDG